MRVGNIGGMVHGQWRVVEDSGDLGSATTSYAFSNLTGDTTGKYQLISRMIGNNSATSLDMTFNSDTSTNYGEQYIRGQNTTGSANRNTGQSSIIEVCRPSASLTKSFSLCDINASSGEERTVNVLTLRETSTTTCGAIQQKTGAWSNTADEITSITLTANTSSGIGIGSRFILLELVDASDGMKYGDMTVNGSLEGCWERIYTETLGSTSTSITASGLDGDNDVIYLVNYYAVGALANTIFLRPNNDSGSNYGEQYLGGNSSTVSAARTTPTAFQIGHTDGSDLSMGSFLIYAKSGYERTLIGSYDRDVASKTIDDIRLLGNSWNNTGDNITSLVMTGTASALGSGTVLDVYRLNL